jgi:hypothetical protein
MPETLSSRRLAALLGGVNIHITLEPEWVEKLA